MNQHVRLFSFTLIAALLLTACSSLVAQPPTPTAQPLVILKVSGSGTITTVLEALKPAFESATPGTRLEVLPGNSTGSGITGILDNILDVAAMARAPKDEETAKNISYFEMGLVSQALIINSSVLDVTNLTNQQIIDIFSGQITNWSQVGGPNIKIVLYVRNEDDSSSKGLRDAILGETIFPDTTKILNSQEEMIASVQGTPGGIGIAAWASVLATHAKVQAININGIAPDNTSYPMVNSSGIGYLADRQNDVQPLIDWLSSTEGQLALKTLGFIKSQQ